VQRQSKMAPVDTCVAMQPVEKLRVFQFRSPVLLERLKDNRLGIVVLGKRAGSAKDLHSGYFYYLL
jgi:hypothetical protein